MEEHVDRGDDLVAVRSKLGCRQCRDEWGDHYMVLAVNREDRI